MLKFYVLLKWTTFLKLQKAKSLLWSGRLITELGDVAAFLYKKVFFPGSSSLNVSVTHFCEVLCRREHESRWNGGSSGFP